MKYAIPLHCLDVVLSSSISFYRDCGTDKGGWAIVGLDIEWRPNNAIHENLVSLLQLCVGNTCLLFQLLHADSIPSSLISFLKDPNYKFLGVEIEGDVEKLIYDHDLGVRNSVDLRDLAKEKTGRGEMKQMGIK